MSNSNVEEIKARLPIEELVGSYVKLEKAGRSFKARCPFHNEKTASFFVSPERGGYYCFGCGAKGDIFSFVEQFEGLDFRGALKVLAERTGVQLVFSEKADGEKDRLFKITEEAAKYFEEQLSDSKAAGDYLKSRGINDKTRQLFRIGWAPEGWRNLLDFLRKKGWSETFIEKAGLIKRKENYAVIPDLSTYKKNEGTPFPPRGRVSSGDHYYDRFRGRIIFPITDSSGRVVAFTGRILKDDGQSAKYLNSPETPLFSKSQILFGLDKAKSEIRRLDYSILVEGQMDLILSHQCGVRNAVAASGTALSDQAGEKGRASSNLAMVKRLSSNMIIALDADKAGRAAAMRAVAATALGLGMSVKIADIEGGKDPADLILKDPEDWRKTLKASKHVVEFELGNILKETADRHRLADAVRRRLFPFLAEMEGDMDKAFYIKMISEKTGLDERAVWADLRKANRKQETKGGLEKTVPPPSVPPSSGSRLDLVERRLFGLLELMEKAKYPKSGQCRAELKRAAADSYDETRKKIEPALGDLTFEAEALYGSESDRWERHFRELLANFEEDILARELMETMGRLRQAESRGDKGEVAALAEKCRDLSMRKAEISRLRSK